MFKYIIPLRGKEQRRGSPQEGGDPRRPVGFSCSVIINKYWMRFFVIYRIGPFSWEGGRGNGNR